MLMLQAEMNNAKLDLGYRDFCAHLLIPLNQCRRSSFYMPWSCGEVSTLPRNRVLGSTRDLTMCVLLRMLHCVTVASRPSSHVGLCIICQERHKYEKCQYLEYKRRVAKMDASRK